METGPIIVISDTHIGRQEESARRFADFLKWLRNGLDVGTFTIHTKGGAQKDLAAAEKLILLGDFLELWGPREADYSKPVKDGYCILDMLFHLRCDKIYVPGNHDDVASRYVNTYAPQNGHDFRVIPKHYPQSNVGVWIGDKKYFFLHGHQFSRKWGVSVVRFFDFVGRFSYESYEASPRALQVGFFSLFLLPFVLALFYAIPLPWARLLEQFPFVTALIAVVWIVLAVLGFAFIWRKLQIIWNRPGHEHASGFMESRRFNRLIGKPKYVGIRDLVNKRYYERGKDTIDAHVIVFGHTHVPELRLAVEGTRTVEGTPKGFVNTGSWVENSQQHDTFAYIDEDGPQLLQWDYETGTAHEFEPG